MKKNNLISNEIYHVFNRGVEKRQLFMDDHDYLRFIRSLLVFNNNRPVLNFNQEFESIYKFNKNDNKENLVDILAFCLMPNHFHLLLKQKTDDGISKFMSKIDIGYANYFNLKYERVGSLFQGSFKSVLIKKESQFLYIPYYIHLNPLSLIFPDWRKKGTNKSKQAVEFLNSYRWSSHLDYIGLPNFNSLLKMDPLKEIFGNEVNYKRYICEFIKDSNFSNIKDILIDDEIDSPNRFGKPYILRIIPWIIIVGLSLLDNLDLLTAVFQ